MIDLMDCLTRIPASEAAGDVEITMSDERTGASLGKHGRSWVLSAPDAAWTTTCEHCCEVAYHIIVTPDEDDDQGE